MNNLGPVIDQSGSIEYLNTVTSVDKFVEKLNVASSNSIQQNPQQSNLVGSLLATQ